MAMPHIRITWANMEHHHPHIAHQLRTQLPPRLRVPDCARTYDPRHTRLKCGDTGVIASHRGPTIFVEPRPHHPPITPTRAAPRRRGGVCDLWLCVLEPPLFTYIIVKLWILHISPQDN